MARAGNEREIAVYQAQRAHELELNRATSSFEHAMVSPLLLLNGGAVVAFLTLLGATSTKPSDFDLDRGFAVAAVVAWVLGLVAATLSVHAGYAAQQSFSKAARLRRERIERSLLTDSPLRAALRRPSSDKPEDAADRGRALQARWRAMFWASLASFLTGVGFATAAALVPASAL